MNRKAKRTGSGGRLRLGLLMATAAAFLLVPAAMASAEVPVEVTIEGGGSGKVYTEAPEAGEPVLNCHWNGTEIDEGVPGPGECVTETNTPGPIKGISLIREADAGSEFTGWTVEEGEAFECSPLLVTCVMTSFGVEPIKVKATFEKLPDVHVTTEGEGSGSVIGVTPFEGIPPIECEWNGETEEQTGVCDALHSPGFFEGLRVEHEAAPGSEFAGWTVEEGVVLEAENCEPLGATCFAIIFGAATEVVIKAKFDLFVPSFPLNLSTSGGGSGTVECDINSGGAGACPAEVKEGSEVEVIATPDTGSDPAVLSGTGSAAACSASPCTFTMTEESSVDAEFNLESVPFTTEVEGEGTVLCNAAACASEYDYGTNIEITATPGAESVLASLIGSGDAEGTCDKEAGTCSFTITAPSGVSAVFASAETIDQETENVHGEVPETTSLTTGCAGDVDLGIFLPGVEERYWKVCNLAVTSTGEESELSAADETGFGEEGHLSQEPKATLYNLAEPLEMTAESTIPLNGVPNGGLEPLDAGGVTLMSYATPVSADSVDAEFSQWIRTHDPLHTGVYSKMITLTLEQTEP